MDKKQTEVTLIFECACGGRMEFNPAANQEIICKCNKKYKLEIGLYRTN